MATSEDEVGLTCKQTERTHTNPPVELIDVLNVAEQSADFLRLEWQVPTVNDATQVVLREREIEREREEREREIHTSSSFVSDFITQNA